LLSAFRAAEESHVSFDIDRLQKATRRVSSFLQKNSRTPGSGAIHKLRTNTRSLEATFVTLGLDSQGNVKRLLRDLAEVRKRAGKVRDMDALTAHALTINQDGEKDCHVRLLEYLGARRDKYARKLRREIKSAEPQLRRNLKRHSKRVEGILEQAQSNPVDSDAARVMRERAIELSSDLNRPLRLNRNNLHPYRLKVKELLNVLQLSNQTDLAFLKDLTEVKDAIGEWHDWEELIAIATQVLDHGEPCKLIGHMKDTSNSKYQRALFLIKELRSNYLRSGNGTRRAHHAQGALLSTPDLDATSAIARN
jgi:CHAD domain-containing protein